MKFLITYKCSNETFCDLKYEDKENQLFNLFELRLIFNGYYCDHQNPDSPIKREIDYQVFPFSITNHIEYYRFHWKIIKYKEETSISGMFRRTDESNGGFIYKPDRYYMPLKNESIYNKTVGNITEYYHLVSYIVFDKNNFGYFDNYSRDKISIFDPIANICSLIITLYGIITFIFCGFYSNSFDNYKIIHRIITNRACLAIINNNVKKDEIGMSIGVDDDNDNDNKDSLLEVSKKDNNDNSDEIGVNRSDINPLFELPKFHFFDFFYNNIYSEKCCNSSGQGIISACNNIISRYYSIESVIYNQLRLENLFKDYKWNNPKLRSFENIDLISQIKELINK